MYCRNNTTWSKCVRPKATLQRSVAQPGCSDHSRMDGSTGLKLHSADTCWHTMPNPMDLDWFRRNSYTLHASWSKALCFKKCNRHKSFMPKKDSNSQHPTISTSSQWRNSSSPAVPTRTWTKKSRKRNLWSSRMQLRNFIHRFLAEQTAAAMKKRVNNDKTDISSDHHCEGRAQDWNRKSTLLISIRPIRHIILQPWHLRHWDFTNFCSSTSVRLALQLIFVPDSFWEVREGRYLL